MTHPADAKLADPWVVREPAARPIPACSGRTADSGSDRSAVRGIVIAVLISVPVWGVIALCLYLVL